jgi:hypothetical protein
MSGDPKRLLVDPDTNDAVRQDLERALAAPPPPYDVSKGLTRLLAVTAPAAAAGLGAGAVAKGAKWALALKWGLGGSAVLATAVVATTVIVSPAVPDAPVSAPAAPTARVAPSAAPAPVSPVDPPVPEVSAPVVEVLPSPSASSSGSIRTRARTQSSDPTSADNRVAREVALLGRARSALSSNPAQALALAEEGHRDFPRGVLREERESIAVLALVRLGRDTEAKARGAAFLERYPHGPFSEKVRSALAQRGLTGSAAP